MTVRNQSLAPQIVPSYRLSQWNSVHRDPAPDAGHTAEFQIPLPPLPAPLRIPPSPHRPSHKRAASNVHSGVGGASQRNYVSYSVGVSLFPGVCEMQCKTCPDLRSVALSHREVGEVAALWGRLGSEMSQWGSQQGGWKQQKTQCDLLEAKLDHAGEPGMEKSGECNGTSMYTGSRKLLAVLAPCKHRVFSGPSRLEYSS
ncbi:hypothetical protein C8R45DRAFT_1077622 [Mycena sanguinolenta]|nr:hypothetical protein C8R45DRAFT_1077622 [Mycena sanguinolenta]